MGRLEHPVHFVCPRPQIWPELLDGSPLPLPARVQALRSGSGLSAWVVQVFHWLSALGEAVTISDRIEAEAINVASVRDYGRKSRTDPAYVVIARADAHEPKLANFVIHQNMQFPETSRSAYVPHWPQPGLIPRDPKRGSTIERLTFMGTEQNLDPAFRTDAFRQALTDIGITLDLRFAQSDAALGAWSDYAKSDAVLAVRGRGSYLERLKPASKLVNAWIAGTPALLGPEPAFRELRRSDLDFFQVTTPDEAVDALRRLRSDPKLYADMVRNGRSRAGDYSEKRIAERWIDLLNTKIAIDFQAWRARSGIAKAISIGTALLTEPLSKRRHRARIARDAVHG